MNREQIRRELEELLVMFDAWEEDEDTDYFGFFIEAARRLNEGVLEGSPLWARIQQAHTIDATPLGGPYPVPLNLTIVRRERSPRGLQGHGRGFQLMHGKLVFRTTLDELLLDVGDGDEQKHMLDLVEKWVFHQGRIPHERIKT